MKTIPRPTTIALAFFLSTVLEIPSGLGQFSPGTIINSPIPSPGPFYGIGALTNELELIRIRHSDYKIVQGRLGEFEIGPAHNQYLNHCWVTSTQVIGEYLGYAMHVPGSHFNVPSQDAQMDIDVGYWGSMEFLDYYHTEISPGYLEIQHPQAYWANVANLAPCSSLGCEEKVADYGPCGDDYGNKFWSAHENLGRWPSDIRSEENDINEDFLAWWRDRPLMGCNDYHDEDNLTSKTRIDDARRIIKAFVDNNLPLMARVKFSHNNVIVGYANLWSDGLPDTAILVDAHQDCNGTPIYRLADNLHKVDSWDQGNLFSIDVIRPWHANLNQGCKEGGWASELESTLQKMKVCTADGTPVCSTDPSGETSRQRRYFGINIECWDNGHLKHEFYATPENPFITIPNNISCDDVVARYANVNDSRQITAATLKRYGYHAENDKWDQFSTYGGNLSMWSMAGRHASQYIAKFPNWGDNYLMVASGLSGSYKKRRTTLDLTFNNGEHLHVEIAPPQVYGINVKCKNDGIVTSYWLEADKDMTWQREYRRVGLLLKPINVERQFVYEHVARNCDNVVLVVRLGANADHTSPSATVTRYGYSAKSSLWEKLDNDAPWVTDNVDIAAPTTTGLSGNEYRFRWSAIWPNNYRFVASDITGEYQDKKTVFNLVFADSGYQRRIEVSPY